MVFEAEGLRVVVTDNTEMIPPVIDVLLANAGLQNSLSRSMVTRPASPEVIDPMPFPGPTRLGVARPLSL